MPSAVRSAGLRYKCYNAFGLVAAYTGIYEFIYRSICVLQDAYRGSTYRQLNFQKTRDILMIKKTNY